MISVEEALRQVLAHAERLPAEQVPLAQANGRVLAADLKALRTQPPADVSAMDGYAVRASDVATAPVRLKVIGEVAAGRPFAQTVGPGEAARIFTGGVLPDGADTVVVQEQTARDGDLVEIQKPSAPARHVRRKGLDFRAGETALPAGHHLRPRDLQLVAGMNYPNVPVYGAPKIVMFATGDELVPPGTEPGPGQIVYSNGFALAALARQEGAEVTDLGVVGDRLDETIAAVRKARRARSRYSGHHRRRVGRRIRFRAEGVRRRRHGAVVLEDRDAAGPAADARHGSAPRMCSDCRAIRYRPMSARSCFCCRSSAA